MTTTELLILCLAHCVDPGVALENAALVKAFEAGDSAEVTRILTEEF